MSVISISTPFNIELEFTISSFGKRALAFAIDCFILWMYQLAFNLVIDDHLPDAEGLHILLRTLLLILPIALYHFLMEVFFSGQSIGKKIMAIRVVNYLGNEASISQYLIRLLFRSFLLLPLIAGVIMGIFTTAGGADRDITLWIFFITLFCLLSLGMFLFYILSKTGQRLGDKLANTLVIENKAKADFHKTIYLEINDSAYQAKYPEVMRLTDRDINGIRNLIDVQRLTPENEAYMARIATRIEDVLKIKANQEPYDFLAQLLRDYNFLTSK